MGISFLFQEDDRYAIDMFWYDKPQCLSEAILTNIKIIRSVKKYEYITKTRMYNFDPLKPHFYIVKLGFTGVFIICLIFAQNIDLGTR